MKHFTGANLTAKSLLQRAVEDASSIPTAMTETEISQIRHQHRLAAQQMPNAMDKIVLPKVTDTPKVEIALRVTQAT